ncbi:MAG TPA: helix-turn-helix domain-containing protein [Solirubrobacteraceae bacterium]|nr:helix-turn-helix domain-containing protein [Solirubrobacteraceae bacterium]
MSRRTPPGRVQDIARAACGVFIAKGYRRALMTDVAERLELSHALLYRYVESKEALLELAARYAMDQEADLEAVVPLATPAPGHVLELLRGWFAVHATFPRLRSALEREPDAGAADELVGIIEELYDFIERNRLLLLLIESLAGDYPALAEASVNDRKRSYNDRLAAFLASRAASGGLRPLPDPEIAAHFLGESVAWFAQHRKRDPGAALIDDQRARSGVRDLLLSAFVPDTKATGMGR